MRPVTNKKPEADIQPKSHHIDKIYQALCITCDILDEIGCEYFLAGGTLLGAKRDGDLIAHDIDFDIDTFSQFEELILQHSALFEKKGLLIKRKFSNAVKSFEQGIYTIQPLFGSLLAIELEGIHVGDICLYTVFSDGLARRFDLPNKVYFNAKMTIPAWFYGGSEYLSIRGKKFRSVRRPEKVLEKIYGPDWTVPKSPGNFASGRNNTSGSVADSDIEMLIEVALLSGCNEDYSHHPAWPQKIDWVGWPCDISKQWILRHEPLQRENLLTKMQALIEDSQVAGLTHKNNLLITLIAARAIQSEWDRQKAIQAAISKKDILIAWLKSLPMPKWVRDGLRFFYKRIRGGHHG